MRPVAFLDASVLYPAGTRNLLMRLAVHHLFRARWSEMVHREWMAAVRRDYPDITAEQIERTRILMDAHADDSIVVGFESLIDSIRLPDPDDRHVVAAAVVGGADLIVTRNTKDFPLEAVRASMLEIVHPDAFVLRLLVNSSREVCEAVREHRASLKMPPLGIDEYLEMLERQDMHHTATRLRAMGAVL